MEVFPPPLLPISNTFESANSNRRKTNRKSLLFFASFLFVMMSENLKKIKQKPVLTRNFRLITMNYKSVWVRVCLFIFLLQLNFILVTRKMVEDWHYRWRYLSIRLHRSIAEICLLVKNNPTTRSLRTVSNLLFDNISIYDINLYLINQRDGICSVLSLHSDEEYEFFFIKISNMSESIRVMNS